MDPPPEGAHDIQYISEHSSKEKLAQFDAGMARAASMDEAFDREFESQFGSPGKP